MDARKLKEKEGKEEKLKLNIEGNYWEKFKTWPLLAIPVYYLCTM